MADGPGVSVLTVGETMALLDPAESGEIDQGMPFTLRVAGAESNFGIALRRLGVGVRWVSRLGADPLGDVIVRAFDHEGLDLRFVERDPQAFTAVFFKWRAGGRSHVHYLRRGSAASKISAGSVPDEAFEGVELVHLTGITMALSPSARRAVIDVARRAKEQGTMVTFDPNYRPALWDGPWEANEAHRALFPYVDWYLCGMEEGSRLFDAPSRSSLRRETDDAGLQNVVVRVGAEGALVMCGSSIDAVRPRRLETVLDEVGAGDGFAAGFAYGLLNRWEPARCAHAGNVLAARALLGTGDWETFPRFDEVRNDLGIGPNQGEAMSSGRQGT